jgi:hypothetical protein
MLPPECRDTQNKITNSCPQFGLQQKYKIKRGTRFFCKKSKSTGERRALGERGRGEDTPVLLDLKKMNILRRKYQIFIPKI